MKKLWIVLGVIAGVIIIGVLAYVSYYNRLVTINESITANWSQVEIQLQRRLDLIPNMVKTVKGYAKHEKGIMAEVTNARKEFLKAKSLPAKVKAGDQMQNALKSIFALSENYPQLRANENFLHLQQELSAIEDKVAYARQYYNDTILDFNNSIKTFPGNAFANIYHVKQRPFLEITESERKVPKVKFE